VKKEATLLYVVLVTALTLGFSGIALMSDRDLRTQRIGVLRQVPLLGVRHKLQSQSNPVPELRAS